MTSEQEQACHAIIHSASLASTAPAAGLAQLPGGDAAVIVPLQIAMIVGIGKVFDIEITEAAGRAVALSMAGMWVGRAASQILVGWIPGLGNAINAATAAGLTEAMGWAVVKKLDSGWRP